MKKIIVERYGPKNIIAGSKFNIQTSGHSALWFEVRAETKQDLVVQLNGHTLKSVFDGQFLTAMVHESLTIRPGKAEIRIFYHDFPKINKILSLNIEGEKDNKLIKKYKKKCSIEHIPNFFIIGAPRSGTTSMYWHLSSHPNVFMSRIKEPYYFDKRAHKLLSNAVVSESDYLYLFKYVPFDATIIGEASATYLSSNRAQKRIKDFNPKAKIMIMLRNPVESTVSMFLRMREGGKQEQISDFNMAWACSNTNERTMLNNYKRLFMIGDQVEKAMTIFGQDQIKIVFFDDLISDSVSVYADILRFLELPIDKKEPIPKGNSAKWKDIKAIVRNDIYNEMIEHFTPQICKIEKIAKRNLNCWKMRYEDL